MDLHYNAVAGTAIPYYMVGMTTHALALANLLTFLLEHHAELVTHVHYDAGRAVVTLGAPPRGATMLAWEWEPSPSLKGTLTFVTPSGILVLAPEHA
jgi:hypothetical protein